MILAETGARAEIEERFLSFRDLFAALFFFVFGLTIDVRRFGGDGEFPYSTFALTAPDRFIIDLEGVVNRSPRPTLSVAGGVVHAEDLPHEIGVGTPGGMRRFSSSARVRAVAARSTAPRS